MKFAYYGYKKYNRNWFHRAHGTISWSSQLWSRIRFDSFAWMWIHKGKILSQILAWLKPMRMHRYGLKPLVWKCRIFICSNLGLVAHFHPLLRKMILRYWHFCCTFTNWKIFLNDLIFIWKKREDLRSLLLIWLKN